MSFTRVNTNVDAIAAETNIQRSALSYSKSVERLSSGLRIVHASDDAAGLAIAEKINNELSGINQAKRNAQDGISLLQTAEGGLDEIHSLLGRARELSVQAASDTNTASDRTTLQNEVTQLLSEIDRITQTTDFNGRFLLNGAAGVQANISDLTKVNNLTGNATTGVGAFGPLTTVAATNAKQVTTGVATYVALTDVLVGAETLSLNGTGFAFGVANTVQDVLTAVNGATGTTGVTGAYDTVAKKFTFTQATAGATPAVLIGGTGDFAPANFTNTAGTDAAITAGLGGASIGVTGGNHVTVQTGTFQGLQFDIVGAGAVTVTVTANNSLKLQVGAYANQNIGVSLNAVSSNGLGLQGLDISTQAGATAALTKLDTAVSTISNQRSLIGATQNRLDHTINNLSVTSENLAAAHSRIRDLDVAAETVNFTRAQILQTAGIAVLAQANQAPNAVLALLK